MPSIVVYLAKKSSLIERYAYSSNESGSFYGHSQSTPAKNAKAFNSSTVGLSSASNFKQAFISSVASADKKSGIYKSFAKTFVKIK